MSGEEKGQIFLNLLLERAGECRDKVLGVLVVRVNELGHALLGLLVGLGHALLGLGVGLLGVGAVGVDGLGQPPAFDLVDGEEVYPITPRPTVTQPPRRRRRPSRERRACVTFLTSAVVAVAASDMKRAPRGSRRASGRTNNYKIR